MPSGVLARLSSANEIVMAVLEPRLSTSTVRMMDTPPPMLLLVNTSLQSCPALQDARASTWLRTPIRKITASPSTPRTIQRVISPFISDPPLRVDFYLERLIFTLPDN